MKSGGFAIAGLLLSGIAIGVQIGQALKHQQMAREAAELGYSEKGRDGRWHWIDPEETKRRYMRQGWVPL